MWVDCPDPGVLSPLESGSQIDFFGLFKPQGSLEVGDTGILTKEGVKGLRRLLGKVKKTLTTLDPTGEMRHTG